MNNEKKFCEKKFSEQKNFFCQKYKKNFEKKMFGKHF